MDARTFLGLESDGTPSGFRLPVVAGITAGGGFLFGGCGLGAAIVALEEVTGRPVSNQEAAADAAAGVGPSSRDLVAPRRL